MLVFLNRWWRAAELLCVMVGLPVLCYLVPPRGYLLLIVWLVALYCYAIARGYLGEGLRHWWNRAAVTRSHLRPILLRFAAIATLIGLGTWCFVPELLFSFVLQKPLFWLLVMVLYPILSVIAQEIIFRSFFFSRYQALFPGMWLMIAASALAFGWAHILFHNWVAPLFCAIGGLFFAHTYHRHRSLALVTIEHALYGNFLFTIGLGRYFYHGSVAAALT